MAYSGSYTIYKKSAAAQFSLMWPRRDDSGRIMKNGAVLVEVAQSIGEKKYDWKNKINFAFGMNDLNQFFGDPDNPGKFIHKTDAFTKILEFSPGEGRYEGTFMMRLSETTSDKASVSVSLSSGEFTVLSRLFVSAIPKIIGWE